MTFSYDYIHIYREINGKTYSMRILITGINGFVGSHLEGILHNHSYQVSGLLRQNRSVSNKNTQLHFINDLAKADFTRFTRGYDIVNHLAA